MTFDAGVALRIDAALAAIHADLPPADPVGAAVRYAVDTGGKRIRPALCLAAIEALGCSTGADHDRAAAAIELIHTYSLVHDDLPCMDNDDLRRGRPTTHRVHGTPAAMVAGFALIPLACRVLADSAGRLGLDDRQRTDAVRALCTGAGAAGMVGGQLLDLEAEGAAVGLEALRRIHHLKTGALFRAALTVGGILGGAAPAALEALGGFGERLGLAFQIMDDVLDVTMDADALGKTPGKDHASSKATFVSLLGLAGARDAAAQAGREAVAALRSAQVESAVLEGFVGFAVHRDR